jgi:hypothetical protein
MAIEISLITEADIPGAIDAIQKAFADDPYNLWVYNDRSKVSVCFSLFVLNAGHPLNPISSREVSEYPVQSRVKQAHFLSFSALVNLKMRLARQCQASNAGSKSY